MSFVRCLLSVTFLLCGLDQRPANGQDLRLWYQKPAATWTEALPLGNGRIGAMVYGGVPTDRVQFNEETLWSGFPRPHDRPGAVRYLDTIRSLLFQGRQTEADDLAEESFMGLRSGHTERMAWLAKAARRNLQGEDPASPTLVDAHWPSMRVPAPEGWEVEGLKDFDGAVWFRTAFELPSSWQGQDLLLDLGMVRDLDYSYCNGQLIGQTEGVGTRIYRIPAGLLRPGRNILAVLVADFGRRGGLCGSNRPGAALGIRLAAVDTASWQALPGWWKYRVVPDSLPAAGIYQASYQPFGDLHMQFDHVDATGYVRALDLQNAVSTVSYTANGVHYTREYFVSKPHQALAVRIRADRPGSLSFIATLTSPHANHQVRKVDGRTIELSVQVKDGALHGRSQLHVVTPSGQVAVVGNRIQVKGATVVELYLAAGTNFRNWQDVRADAMAPIRKAWQSISGKSYDMLKAAHTSDYQRYFKRLSIYLGKSEGSLLPTDLRLAAFPTSQDPAFVALYLQYARYLLISSSRPGTGPANLQGIWNDLLDPPWGSKYTVNINAEMNYWPAETLNLSPMHEPLFQMIEEVAIAGRQTARAYYGAPGWVLHHNTDLWRATAAINAANHGIWVTGGAWLCQHLWEHYLFTHDRRFLQNRAYPILKEAARFFDHFLIEDPITRWLISTPSNSPEQGGLVAGPSMDHQIIRDLFRHVMEAAQILGVDSAFAQHLKARLARIAPDQIGRHGQLQEWLQDRDDTSNRHRHVSHLWAVYPGSEMNWEQSPQLMQAARQSLLYRGDAATGWSLGWKINLWARFLDGDHAFQLIRMLLSPSRGGAGSYPNLFDAHPPFQIDGNFGGAAGIGECILQSHLGYLDLLPALPASLAFGRVRGLCARGGFELDIDWQDGRLERLTVRAKTAAPLRIRYKDRQTVIGQAVPGRTYRFDGMLKSLSN